MELLVIPQEEIVDFLDGYMITPSSTCREVREAVSAWKDDNIIVDAAGIHSIESEITDAEDATDETREDTTEDDESNESSTSNTDYDALAPIKNLIDTMTRDELLEVK